MDHYQFFYADAAGDVIVTNQACCADAAAARALMRASMRGAASAEVWCGARLIGEEDAWACSAIAAVAAYARPSRHATIVLDRFQSLWNRAAVQHG